MGSGQEKAQFVKANNNNNTYTVSVDTHLKPAISLSVKNSEGFKMYVSKGSLFFKFVN